MRGGLSGFLAGALSGYGTVMKFQREDQEDKARKADRAYVTGQRERTTRLQDQQDQLEAGAATAAKPLAVEEQTAQDVYPTPAASQGFMVGGQRYTDRGLAERAVAAGNTPEGINARVAGFYRSKGKVAEAGAIERDALQTKAAGLQVKEAERQSTIHAGLQVVGNAIAANNAPEVERLYNEHYKDGRTGKAQVNPDGTWTVQQFNPDGTPGGPAQTLAGDQLFVKLAAGFDPKLYIAGEQRRQDQVLSEKHRKEDKAYRAERDLKTDQFKTKELDIKGEVSAARAAALSAQAEAAMIRAQAAGRSGAAAAPGTAAVWDDKASAFLRQVYGRDSTIGRNDDDGAGMVLAKTVALAISQRNGGDLDIALGQAIHMDNELRALAKGDPAMHNALRQRYLQAITTPPAAPGSAPAAPAAPPKVPPQPRAASPAAVAAQGLPQPQRGGVGQGKAKLPWEKPEGTF